MSSLVRSVWVGLVLLTGSLSLLGASKAEERAFSAAAKAYNDGWWERAELQLGEFTTNYPFADNRAEAVLLRAESRIKLKNYGGAIELLSAGRATAGRLGDDYLFWLAEAQFQSGKLDVAADLYAQFAREFEGSTRLLEAVVAEASARAQLKQWSRVTEILQRPEGVFQTRAKENPSLPTVVRGRFLLAQTLFDLGQFKDAEVALLPLANEKLVLRQSWQRDYLLASIQSADGRKEQALMTSTNLVTVPTNQPGLLAEGLGFRGRLFAELDQTGGAIAAWRQVLEMPDAASERQREALLRVSDLLIKQDRLGEALQILEGFVATATNSPAADIAWLAVGELRLRQFSDVTGAPSTNAVVAPATNRLSNAQAAFETLLERFPKSPLVGKAQLGRGWCLWLADRVAESETAFESATRLLEPGYDQAVARFKLADARLQLTNYSGALMNYREVAASGATLPEVKSNLVERALYQIMQVAPKAGDDAAANEAMTRLLDEFPEGSFAESGLLGFGGMKGRAADPSARRAALGEFLKAKPDSKLAPAVRLAVAQTYEQERKWPEASEEYAAWLKVYPEHVARARAEYFRALALSRSGDETNAFTQMTNFVAMYPTNEFTALARWWVADYFWREEDFVNAERNYQLLFKNHPGSDRRFGAQLMAGRAAWARQRPDEATAYFLGMTSDTNCPPELEARAYFANGDMLMEGKNFKEAITSYSKVLQLFPNTEIAMLAEGNIGLCCLQLGAEDPAQYDKARRSFDKLLLPQVTNVLARSQAEVGLGLVLEKQSLPGATNQNVVLKQALEHYLKVVYPSDLQPSDPFWFKRAGWEACRVAESLQEWEQLANLCDTLSTNLPSLQPLFEKKKARAIEQLNKSEN